MSESPSNETSKVQERLAALRAVTLEGGAIVGDTTRVRSHHDEERDKLKALLTHARKIYRYPFEPEWWIEQKLGEYVWQRQAEICSAVESRQRVAVPSCFASGKSWLAARLACWWLDTHEPGTAFVVTTATTFKQVKAILWREISRAFGKGKLQGRINQTEWYMKNPYSGREEIVAFGTKPQDLDETAFQGIHAFYVLVIFDEAAGIPQGLWKAAEGLITNEECRWLVIGNPEEGGTEFSKACEPGSGWKVIRIRAYDTPNFTGENVPKGLNSLLLSKAWVEDKRTRWGEKSMYWLSKVEAEFPEVREDGLIPIAWIRDAQQRKIEATGNPVFGVDVGGGGDRSVTFSNRGGHFRRVRRSEKPDTMDTLEDLMADAEDLGCTDIRVDEIGIGKGLCDAGKRHETAKRLKIKVRGINVGKNARDKVHFHNLRAQGFWGLRELFREGLIDIDPDDEDLAADLVELRYARQAGRIKIEEKAQVKVRLGRSPDDGDAIMLSSLEKKHMPGGGGTMRIMWG